jgi:hypothetical protein
LRLGQLLRQQVVGVAAETPQRARLEVLAVVDMMLLVLVALELLVKVMLAALATHQEVKVVVVVVARVA